MQPDKLIRKTESVCPACRVRISAAVVERDGAVFFVKQCREHGDFELLLSRHPRYYRELNDFYFSLMTRDLPQRDYIVHLTNRCNLDCSICLAAANQRPAGDYSQEDLARFLAGKRNFKIDLMGAEPTMREDLPDVIRMVRKSGNRAALHTNGIKIAEYPYLKKLKEAGLSEVHLQFDGFDDRAYEAIRGRRLVEVKLKALENLEKLNISTDLKVTVVRGVNEPQMLQVLEFAVKHSFIKEVFFLGCRHLGRAKGLPLERCLMPDELIDILEEQTKGKISRQGIFAFQKVYFRLLAFFSIRKCFYNQHFLIFRNKNGYSPINTLDVRNIARQMGAIGAVMALAASFVRGFDLSRLSGKGILLGFITACDAYSFDYQIARNCGKGAVSSSGIEDSGALDNVTRDVSE